MKNSTNNAEEGIHFSQIMRDCIFRDFDEIEDIGGKVGMSTTEIAIDDLNKAKLILCNPQMLTPEMCIRIGQAITSAITLLKEQETVVRCKNCKFRDPEDRKCDSGHGIVWNMPRPDDWFCADGEQKDSDNK